MGIELQFINNLFISLLTVLQTLTSFRYLGRLTVCVCENTVGLHV